MPNLSTLNPEQRLAVETVRGPVLILAGAGTGKTRVITHRIAHLIERGTPPGHVLAVTFTNKAAREMRERVASLIPRPGRSEDGANNRPTICTFHSLCVRILRQHIEKLGYKRNFVIYDESEQLGAIRKILAQISAKGEKTDPAAILALLSRFRNGGSRASGFADESVRTMAEHVRERYESALRACNAVDFDDLILLTLRLFNEHPDALEECRSRYRFVMVDEYQDTNASQFRLVHALTLVHRNLCVVGDDDQSIYGWRGAEASNLLDLEQFYPEVKIVKLEQNYRSTNTILRAANKIITHNVRRRAKQLWSRKGDGCKISLQTFKDDEDEARGIVEQIEFARMAKRVPWGAQAILFRTNIQSRPLETALRQARVRYHLIGGQSFFDRREVRDFLAYVKACLNPRDDVSLLRIANTPARGLSDPTMERLLGASHERSCPVFAVMKNPAVTATFPLKTRECIERFVEFIERWHSHLEAAPLPAGPASAPKPPGNSAAPKLSDRSGPLHSWASHMLDDAGYFVELRRQEKDPEAAESRIRNLCEMMATMDMTAAQAGAAASAPLAERLQAFLEEIALDTEREEEEENPGDAVTLITIHSCKGLEFPHVSIVGLEDGLLPHSRSRAEGTMDEERRLFYVAMTRAMETLTLSHCLSRRKYGENVSCRPSPFLKELPPELIERGDEQGRQRVTVATGRNLFASIRESLG
jgi:superfamily I DNA/RNA helicase